MPLIVNMSSVFKLKPLYPVMRCVPGVISSLAGICFRSSPNMISLFAELCDRYADRRSSCCRGSLFGMSNYAWVLKQFHSNQLLIENYKLGGINKEKFLDALLDIFSFLKNNEKVGDAKAAKVLLAETW